MAGFVTWLKAPENRSTVLALGAGALGFAGWATWRVAQVRSARQEAIKQKKEIQRGLPSAKRGEGYIVCPSEIGIPPADTTMLTRGDYVIVEFASKKGDFSETTWARVLSISPEGDRLYIRIEGEYTKEGLRTLDASKHGYHLGDKLIIARDCVFDVLHKPTEFTGQVVCGPNLTSFLDDDGQPMYHALDSSAVKLSDMVEIVVADAQALGGWHEPLLILLTNVSPTKQIFTGIVWSEPELTEQHGLKQFSKISFGRDCIIDIRNPFLE